ncbi:unnamed protein product [Rotaria socialis]
MSLSADSCLTALVFASDMLGTGVFAFQNDLKHIQFRDFLCIFRFYVEIPSNSDSMSKNKQDTENLNSGGNTIDDSKKLKWISFIGENKRNALMELIQNASSPLLRRIEQPILLNIYENEIPSHVINIPKKLFLIYFLVLDPGYLQVECVARKKLELNGKKYDSGSHISLKDNYGEHQLMLAKVGKTSLTLAVRSRSDTKIKVSVKYGSSIPLELCLNKNISNHELMHKIADEAIEEMFLRPNEITRNIVRKSGIADNDATWSSAYTTVLCRAYYGPYTDEYGQEWFGGWIQMKIFAQQCLNCDEYATGELDDQKCRNFVNWLHRWIAHKFYAYPFLSFGYQGRQSDRHHLANGCEACEAGWCHYRGN